MQQVYLKNTLTGKKEKFTPISPGKVSMYACGVTTYDHCHIGHAMQAIVFDVIRNYFEFIGYQVDYVRNYTDVDDKIIARAKELGISPLELSASMIDSVDSDMAALGVRPATHQPKVSESIEGIIRMVETLIEKGAAYPTPSGDVYYRVKAKDDYGKLSNRRPSELRSGDRAIVKGEKEDELDFALWKAETTEGAFWESPWGKGRPGWHIECSAMAKEYLGDNFDIHGGGRDLVFPHHENEIAQSESCNESAYANIWLHSGLMSIDGQKMSKSLGNFITISDFLKKHNKEVLRLSFLCQTYCSDVDFTEELFQINRSRLLYYYETVIELKKLLSQTKHSPSEPAPEFKKEVLYQGFYDAMNDDLNFGRAISHINVTMKKMRTLMTGKKNAALVASATNFLEFMDDVSKVLGLIKEDPEAFISETKNKILESINVSQSDVHDAIEKRKAARENGDWETSDSIRDELAAKGIILKDGKESTDWTVATKV